MNLYMCHYSVHISGHIIYMWSYMYYAAQLQANSLSICKNNSKNIAPIFQLPTHQIRTILPWAPNAAPIPGLAGFSSWHAVLTWNNLTEPDFQMAKAAWVLSRQSGRKFSLSMHLSLSSMTLPKLALSGNQASHSRLTPMLFKLEISATQRSELPQTNQNPP